MRTIDGIDYYEMSDEDEVIKLLTEKLNSIEIIQYWYIEKKEVKMQEIIVMSTQYGIDLSYALLFCHNPFKDNDKFMIPIYHPDFDIKFGMLHDKRVIIP